MAWMSSETDQARLIAERIARRVARDSSTVPRQARNGADLASELAALRESLGEFQRRLTQIESRVRLPEGSETSSSIAPASPSSTVHSPWLAGVNGAINHPSQERFGVEEATVAELVDFFQQEKQCSIDPSGKPCDHCAMCSSRGF